MKAILVNTSKPDVQITLSYEQAITLRRVLGGTEIPELVKGADASYASVLNTGDTLGAVLKLTELAGVLDEAFDAD